MGHFSNSSIPLKSVPKKIFSGVKLGAKVCKILIYGIFLPGKGKSCLGYVLKTSGHA